MYRTASKLSLEINAVRQLGNGKVILIGDSQIKDKAISDVWDIRSIYRNLWGQVKPTRI